MLIEIIKAIIFGIIQGVTEWLPISSTAHLILMDGFLKLNVSPEFWKLFEVVIQLGSILAVVILYFGRLNPWNKEKTQKEKTQTFRLWFMIVIASIPLVAGAIFDEIIGIPDSPLVIAGTLIVYGILFIIVEKWNKTRTPKINSLDSIDIRTAFLVGCFQVLAIIPGTSRSGATIIGALVLGLSRGVAAEFSFFLAIPAMAGASGLKTLKYMMNPELKFVGSEMILLAVATLVSFIVSVYVIKYLMKFIRKHDFTVFGYYRIALGALIIITSLVKLI